MVVQERLLTPYEACGAEQWLQRHPEAGSSWPSWPKASYARDVCGGAGGGTTGSRKVRPYRGTSLTRKRTPLGPYHRPVPESLGGPGGVGVFL